jgi:hypothetical protein
MNPPAPQVRQYLINDAVRDGRPFGGHDLPVAVYFFSRDRSGERPERHLIYSRRLADSIAAS